MNPAAMDAEDFTFPTISEPFPRCIDSPPLWGLSFKANSDCNCSKDSDKEEEEKDDDDQEKEEELNSSASVPVTHNQSLKYSRIGTTGEGEEEEEEKMDMLWEDLNEELLSKHGDSESSMGEEMVRLSCVPALRKPGMVVFIKVLKKLFLLHSSHRRPTKTPPMW